MTAKTKEDSRKKELQTAVKELKKVVEGHFAAATNDKERVAVIDALRSTLEQLQIELQKNVPVPAKTKNAKPKPVKQPSAEIKNTLLPEDDCPEGFIKNRRGDCVPVR